MSQVLRNRLVSPSPWLLAMLLIGPWVWFMGRPWVEPRILAFRDAGNFYEPLFAWQASQWRAGRVPLWNPQIDCGVPAVADATSSTFYPGKLAFALPLPYRLQYHLYLSGHLLLAALSMARLARAWGHSHAAAGLAGMAYAYGGCVLFLANNVVFLVGAAWLPAALWATDRLLSGGRTRVRQATLALAVFLALIVLGGDPQTAYHILLAAILYAVLAVARWMGWFRGAARQPRVMGAAASGRGEPVAEAELDRKPAVQSWREWDRVSGAGRPDGRRSEVGRVGSGPLRGCLLRGWASGVSRATVRLSFAAGLAFLLAAIQILPSAVWTKASWRAAYDQPRNMYEYTLSQLRAGWSSRMGESEQELPDWTCLVATPPRHTHADNMYEFSVGPWHWLEFFWPNLSGRLFPQNTRWVTALPAEGRTWTPSLYLGLLPILLAIRGGLAFRSPPWPRIARRQQNRWLWLRWLTLAGLVGSCGWYGLGWLEREFRWAYGGASAAAPLLAPPAGGLYWLFVVFLPGYVYFRYPAKLLVFAACGLSLLAARGWDLTMQTADEGQQHKRDWGFRQTSQYFSPTQYAGSANQSAKWVSTAGLILGVVSLLGLITYEWFAEEWTAWVHQAPIDSAYGPLDSAGSRSQIHQAAWQTLLVGLSISLLLGGNHGIWACLGNFVTRLGLPLIGLRPRYAWAQLCSPSHGLLLLTLCDLGWANGWMVESIPTNHLRVPPLAAQIIQHEVMQAYSIPNSQPAIHPGQLAYSIQGRLENHVQESVVSEVSLRKISVPQGELDERLWTETPGWRIWRAPARNTQPLRWQLTSSPDRLAEVVAWEYASLVPQHHLKTQFPLIGSQSSLVSRDLRLFLEVIPPTAAGTPVESERHLHSPGRVQQQALPVGHATPGLPAVSPTETTSRFTPNGRLDFSFGPPVDAPHPPERGENSRLPITAPVNATFETELATGIRSRTETLSLRLATASVLTSFSPASPVIYSSPVTCSLPVTHLSLQPALSETRLKTTTVLSPETGWSSMTDGMSGFEQPTEPGTTSPLASVEKREWMGSGLLEPELADALSVRFLIGPAGGPRGDRATAFSTDPAWAAVASGDGWQVWRRRVPRSPAWIVRNVRFIPSPRTGRLKDWIRYAQQVRFLDGRPRDLLRSAILDQPSERPIYDEDRKTAEGIDWSGLLPSADWVDAYRDVGTMSVSRQAFKRCEHDDAPDSDRSSTLADSDAGDTTGSSRDHLLPADDLPKPRWQFPSTNLTRRDSKRKQTQPDVQPTASQTAPATSKELMQVRHATDDQPKSGPERPGRIVTTHKQPESCEVHVHEPGWVQLEVKLDEPAFIVLNQLYTPGWVARSCAWGNQQSVIPREIVRTNLMMCGVWLPSGHHRVDFHYEPAEFFWGAVLSLGTLLGLLGSRSILYCFSKRFRRPVR